MIMAWIIGQPHHQMWSCLGSVVILNLLTFKCLDSSLSLYFLVYDFLRFFFYNFFILITGPSYHFSFQYAF